jgi:formate dehydrogenase gamma subunit
MRMSVSERIQHAMLLVSFFVLVITGFMLSYPDAWWVAGIRRINDSVFELRSLMHRIAAVVMVVASIYHIYYVIMTDRGRRLIRDLLPSIDDIHDAIGMLKYNLHLSQKRPQFGRFGYPEKVEYWALVWGTLLMATTGVIMWFENTFIGVFTKLGWDIARAIHFYEAWLATLAIIIWHLYYVLFNPDTYPMNMAWLTGRLTETEMAEEHPRQLAAIKSLPDRRRRGA